jgi:hypothetical protein
MVANIAWLAGQNFTIADLSGSGLGFYGDSGFGASVKVSFWQGRTFITNGSGTTQGPEVDNVKYLNVGSGILGQTGSGTHLLAIPNYQATTQIRFTNDTAVKVQNAEFRIYDRSDVNKPASGVTTKVAELIHPSVTQVQNGSGDAVWFTPGGSGVVVPLAASPGVSGLYAGNGSNSLWSDTTHDWYLAISCSPDSIGSKALFGAYVSLEFL